jgi:hypothetical protein
LNNTTPAEAGSGQETTTSGDFGREIPGKVPESVPSLFFNSVKPHQFGRAQLTETREQQWQCWPSTIWPTAVELY